MLFLLQKPEIVAFACDVLCFFRNLLYNIDRFCLNFDFTLYSISQSSLGINLV